MKRFDVQFTSNNPNSPPQITVDAADQNAAVRLALAMQPSNIWCRAYDRKTDPTDSYGVKAGEPWSYFTISVSEGY